MDNELLLDVQQIVVVQGSVEFSEYESIFQQAQKLAEQIEKVEVNEENLKESKKLLAAINKRVKELEEKRINVKKVMLEPYQLFEDQVKNIVAVVKNADNEVRQQIRRLEEIERNEKEELLENIFYKRKKMYSLGDLIEFDDFLLPRHLNKTVSIESVEKEMIDFLEKTEKDYQVILSLDEPEKIVSVYILTFDLGQAISHVTEQRQREEYIEASGTIKKVDPKETVFQIMVYEEKDFKLLQLFMDQNKIKYDTDQLTFGGF
jgi:hypothetical protein